MSYRTHQELTHQRHMSSRVKHLNLNLDQPPHSSFVFMGKLFRLLCLSFLVYMGLTRAVPV